MAVGLVANVFVTSRRRSREPGQLALGDKFGGHTGSRLDVVRYYIRYTFRQQRSRAPITVPSRNGWRGSFCVTAEFVAGLDHHSKHMLSPRLISRQALAESRQRDDADKRGKIAVTFGHVVLQINQILNLVRR